MSHIKTVFIGAGAAVILAACATPQNNPHYKYSSKMPAGQSYPASPAQAPVTYQAAHTVQTHNAPSYSQTASYTQHAGYQSAQAHQECLAKEQKRKLVGSALGGAAGAYAGKKLGGDDNETLGLIGGAALGGTAGYGIGNMMMDCGSVAPISTHTAQSYPAQTTTTQSYNTQPYQEQAYQAPAEYVQPAPVIPAQSQQVTQATIYAEPAMVETGGQNAAQTGTYTYNNGGYVTDAAITAPAPEQTQRLYDIPAQAALPTPAAAPQGMTYIVQEGDTAWNLSRKTCSGISDIKGLNNLEGDFLIKAGEAILLPPSQC